MTQPRIATQPAAAPLLRRPEPANLADILERVLDKGIVVAGDIRVNLLDIELLTIRIRLLIASVDRAREMGIDWWEHDPTLSSGSTDLAAENRRLRRRLGELTAGRTRQESERAIDNGSTRADTRRHAEQPERKDRQRPSRTRLDRHD
jgi:Gas vesicle protein